MQNWFMDVLNLPQYNFTIKEVEGKKKILDKVRKKYVALTPEEWVRQHFVLFLIEELKYPASLMAIEAKVSINGLPQRADIVVYDRSRKPILIVECKAPKVKITKDVFDQAARYNINLRTNLLVVTNGMNHYCAAIGADGVSYQFLEKIPLYGS